MHKEFICFWSFLVVFWGAIKPQCSCLHPEKIQADSTFPPERILQNNRWTYPEKTVPPLYQYGLVPSSTVLSLLHHYRVGQRLAHAQSCRVLCVSSSSCSGSPLESSGETSSWSREPVKGRGRKGGKEERFHFEHQFQEKYELLSWSMIPKFECMSMEVYCIANRKFHCQNICHHCSFLLWLLSHDCHPDSSFSVTQLSCEATPLPSLATWFLLSNCFWKSAVESCSCLCPRLLDTGPSPLSAFVHLPWTLGGTSSAPPFSSVFPPSSDLLYKYHSPQPEQWENTHLTVFRCIQYHQWGLRGLAVV